ncbi:MAG: putative metal-binding motif-containing protein [Pseudomonadota bacterium]|nr:putative metal-binding motif-containing protein [Pseudomonadota bacterium]
MRLSLLALLSLTLVACPPPEDKPETGDTNVDDTGPAPVDEDGDGFLVSEGDCDDSDPALNPGAEELCDAVDNDCDSEVDNDATDATDWYADADADGFGDGDVAVAACEAPAGYVTDATDCDDAQATVYPAAAELCDGLDNDCDGAADEDTTFWYADTDADGFGDPASGVAACAAPTGSVADASDCDDTSPLFHPGADESDCTDPSDYNCDGSTGYADVDGDGFAACTECDDAEPNTNPDALEACNEVDDDCDGVVDDDAVDQGTWFLDADGDGWGDDAVTVGACGAPAGYVAAGGDCDDADAAYSPSAAEADCADPNDYNCDGSVAYADADADGWAACEDCDDASAGVHPDATESCNTLDDDCDGSVDEDAIDATASYTDADLDGHGDASTAAVACDVPEGAVLLGDDCDDTSPLYHPGADESDCADPNDYNCDGSVAYADADGDGFAACDDCDDTSADVNPDAAEACNTVDDDCDGVVDESDAIDLSTWYLDADGDGYGTAADSLAACDAPNGYVATADDCDDTSGAYNPGAAEADCADPADYNCDGSVAYADADADGFAACQDCDDTLAAVNPDAAERCNALDDNCDGTTDEPSAIDAGTWHADADGDSYGDPATATIACDVPTAYVADASDCDDSLSGTYPGAEEVCDGADQDCDGLADDDATDALTFYADSDSDTFGDADAALAACTAPSGYVVDASDCDDALAMVYPGADETCDDLDEDCDGAVDEDAIDPSTWYADADSDGHGGIGSTATACDAPAGYLASADDCDDSSGTTYPGADETCNGADDDCDGSVDDGAIDPTTWYADADNDGVGTPDVTVESCDQPAGYVATGSDCDDTDPSLGSGATEICDGVDNDCDGAVDEADAADALSWYADADGDGTGDPAVGQIACDAPAGYVSNTADCDDADGTAYPGADEYCDGADDNCDGAVDEGALDAATYYADIDGDGYGDPGDSGTFCFAPTGYAATADDCDPTSDAVNPGAAEVCDGVDNDCDGAADEEGATGEATWYADADEDGYGDAEDAVVSCNAPELFVADATDCDDTESGVHPGATEVCENGLDDDCSGEDECAYDGSYDALTTATSYWTGVNGGTSTSSFGSKIVGEHDFDGDGIADIAIGDRLYDASSSLSNMGRVTIFQGTGTGIADTVADPTATLTGSDSAGRFGQGLAAGDIDGDGIDDLIVGTPAINGLAGGSTAITDNGKAYVFLGPIDRSGTSTLALTPATGADCSVEGSAARSYLGNSVAFGGDLTGDGSADWVYGAYQSYVTTGTAAGYVGIVTTCSTTALSASVQTIAGAASDVFGLSVLADLDLDGDGEDDLLVAASGTDSVYAFLGPIVATARADADATVSGMDFYSSTSSPEDLYGDRIGEAGDADGDGYAEFLVGANSYDVSTNTSAGAAFLFSGADVIVAGSDTADNLATLAVYGDTVTFNVGAGVSRAGDVDADGREDLLVGISGDTVSASTYGATALFYGGASGSYFPSLATVPDGYAMWNAEATTTGSGGSGGAVAPAGDMDGDGFDDFLFANMTYGTTRVGRVYLVGGTGE